jgi:hypothetical protein
VTPTGSVARLTLGNRPESIARWAQYCLVDGCHLAPFRLTTGTEWLDGG